MRSVAGVLLVLTALTAAGCASGESFVRAGYDFSQVESVAVAEVEGDLESEAAKNQIAGFFAMELLEKGYKPVERKQVKAVLEEQEFQSSDLTADEGAARAGRILNVDALLLVNIPNFGEEMSMTAKLIDVEDASILWMGSGAGGTGRTLGTLVGVTVGAVIGIIVGGDKGGKIAAGVAGGVLGGVAGHALSPQKATQAQKVIQELCERLPSKLAQQ